MKQDNMHFIKTCLLTAPFLVLFLQVATIFANVDKENSFGFINETERQKRDIRDNIYENGLLTAGKTYNSELTSQSKSAVNSIIAQVNGLNGQKTLLNLNFNNLAINGFNELSSIGSKLPFTIQNCYNNYGFKFSDVINVAKTKAGQCLTNKINEAKSIVQDFQTSIADAVANIKDVSQQITECRLLASIYPSVAGLIAKVSCLNIAIYSLRGETILLPLKFAILVGQAFNSITTIHSDKNECGLEIVNTILDQSIQSGKAVNNCINEQYVVSGSNSTTAAGSS